eukprot:1568569-Pyramimonas_sp.AAC.1
MPAPWVGAGARFGRAGSAVSFFCGGARWRVGRAARGGLSKDSLPSQKATPCLIGGPSSKAHPHSRR